MVSSDITKQQIYSQSIKRIATVFSVPVESLKLQDQFDVELGASFVSDFKHNEFDKIMFDLADVSDRGTLQKLRSGDITILTVRDYCEYMCACFENKPKDVGELLGL